MTDRELMAEALEVMMSAINSGDWKVDGACDPHVTLVRLTNRLAQPEPEPAFYVIQATDRFGEGYEQTYWEDHLGFPVYTRPVHAIDMSQERVDETVKHRHEPVAKWDPQVVKTYSPDGVLLSEKIRHTPDGEWQEVARGGV